MKKQYILPKRIFTPDLASILGSLASDLAEMENDFTHHPERLTAYPLFTSLDLAQRYLNSISQHEQGEVISNIFYSIELDNIFIANINYGRELAGFRIKLPLANPSKQKMNISHCVVNAIQVHNQEYAIEVISYTLNEKGEFKQFNIVEEELQAEMPDNAKRHGRRISYQKFEAMQEFASGYNLIIPTEPKLPVSNLTKRSSTDQVADFMQACKAVFSGWIEKEIQQGYAQYQKLYPAMADKADIMTTEDLYLLAKYHKHIQGKNLFWLQKVIDRGHLNAKIDLIELYYQMGRKQKNATAKNKAYELCLELWQDQTVKLKSKQKKLVLAYMQALNPNQPIAETQAQEASVTSSQETNLLESQTMVVHDTYHPTQTMVVHDDSSILKYPGLIFQQPAASSTEQKILHQAQCLANKLPCPLLIKKFAQEQKILASELIDLIEFAKLQITTYQSGRESRVQKVIAHYFREPDLSTKRNKLANDLQIKLDNLKRVIEQSNETEVPIKPLLLLIDQTMVDNQTYSLEHGKNPEQSRRSVLYNALLEIGVAIFKANHTSSEKEDDSLNFEQRC